METKNDKEKKEISAADKGAREYVTKRYPRWDAKFNAMAELIQGNAADDFKAGWYAAQVSMAALSAREIVDVLINATIRAPERLVLPADFYAMFIREIEPLYIAAYSGLMTAPNSDMENVIYRGVQISADSAIRASIFIAAARTERG